MWSSFYFPTFLSIICIQNVRATVPTTVNIGGLFSVFNSDGTPNNETMQLQAAFLMGIEAINNKSDGFYDNLLPGIELKYAIKGSSNGRHINIDAARHLLGHVDIDGDVGVHALINGLVADYQSSAVSSIISEMVDDYSSSLVQGTIDRNFDVSHSKAIEIAPLPVNKGLALQDIICNHFEFRKVAIFFSPNQFGIASLDRFTNGDHCDFDIYFELSIEEKNIELQIGTISEENYDSRVFVILMDEVKAAGHLLETGYKAGLFRLGTQIFLVDEIMDIVALKSGMSPAADTTRILHGIIGIRFWPSYWFHTQSTENNVLFQQWRTRPSTLGTHGGPCNNATDDSGSHYLYQNEAGTVCAGIDFASFATISDITPFASFIFDAVAIAAAGLHHLLITESLPLSSNADVYHDAVVDGAHIFDPFHGKYVLN